MPLAQIESQARRDEFHLRHGYLAMMPGVHQPTVPIAAKLLQAARIIDYSRGNIKILDAEGLTEGSSDCPELMASRVDKVFDKPWRDLVQAQDKGKAAS